ncbi:MAG TPA: GNAT family N-acetyltransferase [Steroidobacteraceae bacterium]|nr:GNAT family N-acetyltransferase [Steroidobacteraceae bacterium]
MNLTVRSAEFRDLEFIARGNAAMALETEHRSLDEYTVRRGVLAAFEEPARGRYFVVETDGRVVGQLLITYEWSDWRNGAFWWIQSVYVLPEARRSGAFRALYQHVEGLARRTPEVCGLRLYVELDNERAQATYRRCGMVDAGYRVMEVDYSGAVHTAGG